MFEIPPAKKRRHPKSLGKKGDFKPEKTGLNQTPQLVFEREKNSRRVNPQKWGMGKKI